MTEQDDSKLAAAIAAFDQANGADPTRIVVDGVELPRELLHAKRLSEWVARLEPHASTALTLAARCQHLCRWEVPRASYEPGRTGYLKWRKDLSHFHADRASEILRSVGYDEETIERVRHINLKRGLRTERDVQTVEDALCLAFLQYELEEFAGRHPAEKVVDILRKTWRKMSERAHQAALSLSLPAGLGELVKRALDSDA
jgi:hypothetical protein